MEQERSSQGASDEQLFRKRRAAMEEQAMSSIRGGDERHGIGDEQRDE